MSTDTDPGFGERRGEFGPGEVYNRRVTNHLQSLLPDATRPGDSYTFGGSTVLGRDSNPGRPAGGTCRPRRTP